MKNVILLLFAFIIACGQPSDKTGYGHEQEEEIKQALTEMLSKSTDPFLIVEDPTTENFIQFYNDGGRMLVDLPEDALAPDQLESARSYFTEHGIPLQVTQDIDPESGRTFLNRSWTTTYSRDQLDEVVQIALGALSTVYGISSTTRLKLTKGWE